MKYDRFERLPVWQVAMELAIGVFALTDDAVFGNAGGLKDQMRRASVSVSNNIAEGFELGEHDAGDGVLVASGELEPELVLEVDHQHRAGESEQAVATAGELRPVGVELVPPGQAGARIVVGGRGRGGRRAAGDLQILTGVERVDEEAGPAGFVPGGGSEGVPCPIT